MIRLVKNAFLSLIIAASLSMNYWVIDNHVQIVHIISDSMAPSIKRGDMLLVKSKPTAELNVGDIAILPSLKDKGVYYSHRIIQIYNDAKGDLVVKTKGDANPIADETVVSITSSTIPVSLLTIPTSNFLSLVQLRN